MHLWKKSYVCQKASLTLLLWSSIVHVLEFPGHVSDGVVRTLHKSILRSTVAHRGVAVLVAPQGMLNVVSLWLSLSRGTCGSLSMHLPQY